MSEDEEDIRQYMPVFRRIIILVAVLTAVPLVMWTITAFVRTYVGPPRLPTFQPAMAATAPAGATPVKVERLTKPATTGAPTTIDAQATGTDAGGAAANAPAPATPGGAPAAPMAIASANYVMPDSRETPVGPPDTAPTMSAQQPPAAADWPPAPSAQPTLASVPADEPAIAGRVPLPRKRPRMVTVAQATIPLPRARPEAAGPTAPPTGPATPFDWIHNIFQHNNNATPPADAGAPADGNTPNQ
jgi:hypothetical protein